MKQLMAGVLATLVLPLGASAATLVNETYNAQRLFNEAQFPTRVPTLALGNTRLDFGNTPFQTLQRLAVLPLTNAGDLSGCTSPATINMTLVSEQLTGDDDLKILVDDGLRLVGGERSDTANLGGNAAMITGLPLGTTRMQSLTRNVLYTNAGFQGTFNVKLTLGAATTVALAGNGKSGSATASRTLDPTRALKLVLLANDDSIERYRIASVGVVVECPTADSDGDGVPDAEDVCPDGDDNVDTDGDSVPDFCDSCPLDVFNDSDGDGSCDGDDLCVGDDASGDGDGDGLCNDTDPCVGASNSDADGDGICDEGDLCFGNDATGNSDGDGVCNDLDACTGDDATGNTDGDLFCNDLDICPLDVGNDADGDGLCESNDNCPTVPNSDQSDLDGDGVGDACDDDIDGDGVLNGDDNCVFDVNPGQADFDGDGAGDACDADIDDDGVVDAGDACVPTPVGEVVNGTGCSIAELCPCAHPAGGDRWKNHGAYVSCVAHQAKAFVSLGLITETEKGEIVSQAGMSSCGHKR